MSSNRLTHTARIVGVGMTKLSKRSGLTGRIEKKLLITLFVVSSSRIIHPTTATELMQSALQSALGQTGIVMSDLDGLIAVPSLSHPHFMEAHYLATKIGMLPQSDVVVRTVDTGGASPITALLEARRMIMNEDCKAVAITAGDSVGSMDSEIFLKRADAGCRPSHVQSGPQYLPSPVIPHGYSRVTKYHMEKYVCS